MSKLFILAGLFLLTACNNGTNESRNSSKDTADKVIRDSAGNTRDSLPKPDDNTPHLSH